MNSELEINYYLQKVNPKTGRTRDLHICKMVSDWIPLMHGYRDGNCFTFESNSWYMHDLRTWLDWKWYLLKETKKGGIIFDEWNDPIPLKEFFGLIQTDPAANPNKKKKNHILESIKKSSKKSSKESLEKPPSEAGFEQDEIKWDEVSWVDIEGYSFYDGEFE